MSQEKRELGRVRGNQSKNAADCYISGFAGKSYTAFGQALSLFIRPGAPHSELIAFFDGRATAQQIKDWRLGRSAAPAWAREVLGAKLAAIATAMAAERAGAVGQAGTEALRRYRLERRAQSLQR